MDPAQEPDRPAADIKFSRQSGFFDRNRFVRGIVALVFAFCLWGFLHYREVRLAFPERDTIAERYIVAQVDFTFLDEELTAYEREQAVRDIGKIYRLSEEQVRERRLEFEEVLSREETWRRLSPSLNYRDMVETVEQLEDSLQSIRFTDARTLNKMHQVNLPTASYLLLYARGAGEALPLMEQAWEQIREIAFGDEPLNADAVSSVTRFFQDQAWVTEEDVASQEKLRGLVKQQVPRKYSTVRSGSRVVNQGDRITQRHIAMLQAMKRAIAEQRNLWHPVTLMGSLLLTLSLLGVGWLYLKHYHQPVLKSNRRLTLLLVIALAALAFAKGTEFLMLRTPTHILDYLGTPIVVPFAAVMLCCLLSSNLAMLASGFLTVALSTALAVNQSTFLILNIVSAVVTTLSTRNLKVRKEIFSACLNGWGASLLVLIATRLYAGQITAFALLSDVSSVTFYMGLTGVLVVGLLPVLESTFGIITDMTMMEYMDPNHELLRRLSIEAPGTYQHSVVVGNLAEAAALAISANGLFCRVSTLYHDIGKLTAPHYFTENQQSGMNMHQLLTPHESAQVIMSHVSEGVAMARKAGLPEPFIDVIKEHHGTTLVYYFFHKAGEQSEDPIDEALFRYAGPRPRTKESALIMIADTLEAASRSLDEINEESVTTLLDRLVRDKAEDGQFNECQLTFEELGIAKQAMIKTLLAAGHSRIKYPERIKTRDINPSPTHKQNT